MSSVDPEEIFRLRRDNGLYNDMAQKIIDNGNHSLANVDFGDDFYASTEWNGRHTIFITKEGDEYFTLLLGEILPASMGTLLSAKGNHFMGSGLDAAGRPQTRYIEDSSKVKWVFALGFVSEASDLLSAVQNNQIGTLNQIRAHDIENENLSNRKIYVHEWIAAKVFNKASDIILVTSQPIYAVPDGLPVAASRNRLTKVSIQGTTTEPTRLKKRLREEEGGKLKADGEAASESTSEAHSTPYLGKLYPPTLLEDYGGPLFRQRASQLVQLGFYDLQGELVSPDRMYDVFRPGTFVLVKASLHVFTNIEHGAPVNNTERKTYQVRMESMSVLAKSPLEAEKRYQAVVNSLVAEKSSRGSKKADDAFDSFFIRRRPAADKAFAAAVGVSEAASKSSAAVEEKLTSKEDDVGISAETKDPKDKHLESVIHNLHKSSIQSQGDDAAPRSTEKVERESRSAAKSSNGASPKLALRGKSTRTRGSKSGEEDHHMEVDAD